jgi:hypothetical protein
MNRRTLLAGLGTAAAAGGVGYTGYHVLRDPPAPGPATNVAFSIVDEQLADPTDGPTIDVDTDQGRLRATGSLYVGPPACYEASLENVVYDSSADKLAVRISWSETLTALFEECSGARSANSYRLTIDVERVPDRFTVIERDFVENSYRSSIP